MSQSQQLTIKQAISRAKKATKQGNFDAALQLYNAILQRQPQHMIAKKRLRKLQNSLQLNQTISAQMTDPSQDQINALINLYNSGQLTKAEHDCRRLLHAYPQSLIVHNILGTAFIGQGKLREAVQAYDKAIQLKPDYAEAYNNRGVALRDIGQLEESVKSYDKAIQLKPDYTEAYNNRGVALSDLGQLEESVRNYDKAIQLKPGYAEAHYNLGNAMMDLRQLDAAAVSYQKAVTIDPRKGLFWAGFANCLRTVNFTSCGDDLVHFLLQMLEQPVVHPVYISKAVISALRHHPEFSRTLELFGSGHIDENIDHLTVQLSTIPLLLRVMELSTISDIEVEKMFTQMRKSMLNKVTTGKIEAQCLPFYAALAMHCFTNEYVFCESEKETQEIEYLLKDIKTVLENGDTVPPTWIMVLGAYRPLYSFSWSDKLLESEWSGDIKKVIAGQVSNIRKEQALRSQIPHLTLIEDKVSQAVRDQYESNPYPRWVNTGLSDKPRTIKQVLQGIKLHLDFNNQQFSNKPDILVAGCGTGQHALTTASRFLNCNVLAVDLSLNSLSYAMRKTQEMGTSNIEYKQGDILQLNHIEKKFDIIESVGVLHHMDNPLAGWKILVEKLRTGGFMKIGLYSDIARQQIVEFRALIKRKRFTASPEDIRRFRSEIINRRFDSDSRREKVLGDTDFYSLSECRDMLFHVQEHRFTLPHIEVALKDLGLKFLGFELNQRWVMRRFSELYPEKDAPVSLSLWHQFELRNPDTFKEMYQFWVQKQ